MKDSKNGDSKVVATMESLSNEYLALRKAKIARNEARLAELGLIRPAPSQDMKKDSKKSRTNASRPISGVRRSTRSSGRLNTYLIPDAPELRKKRPQKEMSDQGVTTKTAKRSPTKNAVINPKSARLVDLNVETLVLGTDGMLGKTAEYFGKAFVMEEAVRLGSNKNDVHGLSFNKYCGVQEWKNDAIFLWVNIGAAGDVINDFLNGGQQITWFGGSRMHSESKQIKHLLRVGRLATDARLPSADGVVLWCRQYNKQAKRFTNYKCLGRLAYQTHEPEAHPVKFVWSLLDYEKLTNHNDKDVRNMFQSIVAPNEKLNYI